MRKLTEKLKRGRREARKAERGKKEGKALPDLLSICVSMGVQSVAVHLKTKNICASPYSPLTSPRRTKRRVREYLLYTHEISFFLSFYYFFTYFLQAFLYSRPVYVLSRRISCYTTCGLAILYSLQTHCFCSYKILSNLHDTNTVPITYLSIYLHLVTLA